MERKIGEIFEYNGEWYQCIVKGFNCTGCDVKDCPNIRIGACSSHLRNDGRQVKFKKLKKVGEPFTIAGILYQHYKVFDIDKVCGDGLLWVHDYKAKTVTIELKQNKDMEEKKPTYEELLHYYHSTVGLWAIDRSPQEVSLDWICDNAFQLGIDEKDSNSENIGKNLKEFDLEAAKQGKPVCTRDGRKARIICFDKKKDIYPLVALVTDKDGYEIITPYKADGVHPTIPKDDLVMLPETKEGYILLSKDDCVITDEEIAKKRCTDGYFVAKVSWEV